MLFIAYQKFDTLFLLKLTTFGSILSPDAFVQLVVLHPKLLFVVLADNVSCDSSNFPTQKPLFSPSKLNASFI